MKVCSCPAEVPEPKIDFSNINTEKWDRVYEDHAVRLREWLVKNGFDGEYTGEIVRFPVADGYAQYMLASGKSSFLIHLPYWDAWHYRDVKYLPKAEIINRIKQQKSISKLFSGGDISKQPAWKGGG